MKLTKINESFSLVEGTEQELIQIQNFYKVEREGQYFDPLVKRGFKSPYDFFTKKVQHNSKDALIIMSGLVQLHPVLSTLQEIEVSGFSKVEISEFLDTLKGVIPFELYDYQREGIIEMLTGKPKSIGRFCTGSGKSVIISAMVEFFRRKSMKGILLVPNVNLLTQFQDDIKEYNLDELHSDLELIGGGRSVKDVTELDKTLTISTWQSMQNFEGDLGVLDFVIQDECLHPESLISTLDGLKEIQHLKVNDLVLTLNESTKEQEYKPIKKVHKNLGVSSNEKMFEIRTESGNILKITGNHKVNTQRGWVRADSLTLDDSIISLN